MRVGRENMTLIWCRHLWYTKGLSPSFGERVSLMSSYYCTWDWKLKKTLFWQRAFMMYGNPYNMLRRRNSSVNMPWWCISSVTLSCGYWMVCREAVKCSTNPRKILDQRDVCWSCVMNRMYSLSSGLVWTYSVLTLIALLFPSSFRSLALWQLWCGMARGKKTKSIIPTFKGTNLQSIREKDSPVLLQSTLEGISCLT